MKTIKLTRGYETIVDDDVYERIKDQRWRARPHRRTVYVVGTMRLDGKLKTIHLHRFIMGFPKCQVDHRDRDGLNNLRSNLRLASDSENKWNAAKMSRGSSQYKGVRLKRKTGHWTAQISLNSKTLYLGCFPEEISAALAYDSAARELRGKFAATNQSLGLL